MTTHFIVHEPADDVGVVVVEGIHAGDTLTGWVMSTDDTVRLTAADDIPIGHKLAVRPKASGDTLVKYGHDIGRVVADIPVGGHVHVHNVKTARW